jgi:hypothetical protein
MVRFYGVVFVTPLVAFALLAALVGSPGIGLPESPAPAINSSGGIGLKGYDPVAYFTGGQPTKGAGQYSFKWKGVTYRFASA